MDDYVSTLVGVPLPEFLESPASWLSRVALSQGVDTGELLDYLGESVKTDLDLHLNAESLLRWQALTGISSDYFSVCNRMAGRLRSIDPSGQRFLTPFGKTGRYRFCPVCLHTQPIKYFPWHWRHLSWHYCPVHHCPMQDQCPSCCAPVRLPYSLMSAGAEREGIGDLGRCVYCSKRLSINWKSHEGTVTHATVQTGSWQHAQRGRAVLAALYYGHVAYADAPLKQLDLSELSALERRGLLPTQSFEFSFRLNMTAATIQKPQVQ